MRHVKTATILKCQRLLSNTKLISIKPYLAEHKPFLVSIFNSNVQKYFAEEELPLFSQFLDEKGSPYFVVLRDDVIVGSGGIALGEPKEFINEKHVVMTWGMIDKNVHKQGLGTQLLEYRIQLAKQMYPNTKIALGTTQYSYPFFEKFGFKTLYYKKDFWAKDLDLYHMELQ